MKTLLTGRVLGLSGRWKANTDKKAAAGAVAAGRSGRVANFSFQFLNYHGICQVFGV